MLIKTVHVEKTIVLTKIKVTATTSASKHWPMHSIKIIVLNKELKEVAREEGTTGKTEIFLQFTQNPGHYNSFKPVIIKENPNVKENNKVFEDIFPKKTVKNKFKPKYELPLLNRFSCLTNEENYVKQTNYMEVMEINNKQKCKICPFRTKSTKKFQVHIKKRHIIREGKYSTKSSSSSVIIKHEAPKNVVLQTSTKNTIYKCGHCDFRVKNIENLYKHTEEIHEELQVIRKKPKPSFKIAGERRHQRI